MTELTLPTELRPADGRFGSGPSKVPQAALDALAATGGGVMGTSHRRERVRGQVQRLREGLATYFSLPDGYEVVLGNGGATLFWDAAAASLIDSRSAHAVFGEFSAKFAAVVRDAPFLDDPAVKDSPVGTHPHLEAVDGVDAYALTHCETSTGVVAPVARPAGADEGALVLVDATSAAGGVDVDVAEADAYYFSPQKAFASDGGLWVALMSPAALERVRTLDRTGRWVPAMLDLRQAVENSRKQQTLNTPAVATLLLMVHQLEAMLEAGGLAKVAGACADRAGLVYGWADSRDWATPFVRDPAMRSPVVCTVDLDEAVPVGDVTATLRAAGILDVEPYRKLGRNQLRIATFPAVDAADVERLLSAVEWCAERLGG